MDAHEKEAELVTAISDLEGELAEVSREIREERRDPLGPCPKIIKELEDRWVELRDEQSCLDEYLQEVRATIRFHFPGDY